LRIEQHGHAGPGETEDCVNWLTKALLLRDVEEVHELDALRQSDAHCVERPVPLNLHIAVGNSRRRWVYAALELFDARFNIVLHSFALLALGAFDSHQVCASVQNCEHLGLLGHEEPHGKEIVIYVANKSLRVAQSSLAIL